MLEDIQAENAPNGHGVQVPMLYGTQSSLDFLKYCRQIGDSCVSSADLSQTSSKSEAPPVSTRLIETRKQLDSFRSSHFNQRSMETGSSDSLDPLVKESGKSEEVSRLPFSSKSQHGLQRVREQMANALSRLRYLEDEVKLIPKLKIKLSILQQEKQKLRSELELYKAESRTETEKHGNTVERQESMIPCGKTDLSDTVKVTNEAVAVEDSVEEGFGSKCSTLGKKTGKIPCCNVSCYTETAARPITVQASTNTPAVEMKDCSVTVIPVPVIEYTDRSVSPVFALDNISKVFVDQSTGTEDDDLLNEDVGGMTGLSNALVSDATVEFKDSSVQTMNVDIDEQLKIGTDHRIDIEFDPVDSCASLVGNSERNLYPDTPSDECRHLTLKDGDPTDSSPPCHVMTHSVSTECGGIDYADAGVGDFELHFASDASTSMLSAVELKECSVGTDDAVCQLVHVGVGYSNPQCLWQSLCVSNTGRDCDQLVACNVHGTCSDSIQMPGSTALHKAVQVQPTMAEISTLARIMIETSEASVATDVVEMKHVHTECPDRETCHQQSYSSGIGDMNDIHHDATGLGFLTSEIGEYVGKVDMLLEEQQSLLADNLKDFDRVLDGNRTADPSIPQKSIEAEIGKFMGDHPSFPVQDLSVAQLEEEQPIRRLADHLRSACMTACVHINNSDSPSDIEFEQSLKLLKEEWFMIAANQQSAPKEVQWFVAEILEVSPDLLPRLLNTADSSGNTALHYAVSLRNFSVLLSLVGTPDVDVNLVNNAGYTACMLASIINIENDFEEQAVEALFSKADVNVHAQQAGQTALMLAVSHGCCTTARLLLQEGADVNAKDEDGSTALMCAIEHGHLALVKMLLSSPRCDPTITDKDGSTALDIAVETNQRNIAILLYARLKLLKPADCDPD